MPRTPLRSRSQQGAAIVTAMLVVTLATLVVSGLFWREHVTIRSVENRLAIAQSRWIERAAIDWARVILLADLRNGAVDHLGEPWAVPVAETRLDETVTAGAKISDSQSSALIAGQILDAQARFNLNGLVKNGQPSEPHLNAFRKLLSLLGKPESLADMLLARLLQSQAHSFDGRMVGATAVPLIRVADLLTVAGFDENVVRALEPYVLFLPRATTINLNTAPAEVIAALSPRIDLSAAQRLVSQRERTFFQNRPQAEQIVAPGATQSGQSLPEEMFSVGTSFFMVVGMVRYGRVEGQTETLLERQARKVEVVWQRRS